MTSNLPASLANSSRKVVVKGKYLASIESYVSTLVIGDNFLCRWNPEFEELQESIVRLHNRFLSKSNAIAIIFNLCMEFEIEHQGRIGPLSDLNNSDLQALFVERIKTYIESLPRKYTLRIGLPSFPQWDITTDEISKSIRFVIGDTQPNSLGALLRQSTVHKIGLPHFDAYIEFSTSGYSDWSPDSLPASVCLSLAKQCAFILTTHGGCQRNFSQNKASATLTDESVDITKEINLPDSIARCFGQLIPNEKELLVYDNKSATILGDLGRPAVTNGEKAASFRFILRHLQRFFEADDHPDFEGISAAIEWYQDSIFADNQSFSYIAACIGLEALFGSNNHIDNLSKRLADRYAFLLGKSRSERELMIKEYTDVLNLRGRLVHSKAARLNEKDSELLRAAQKMLLNAIWHELYAMYKAREDNKSKAIS
jgi:hypothetical protein